MMMLLVGWWCDYAGQSKFVSGTESSWELSKFRRFMGNNSARLDWPYSNPNYTIVR